MVLHRGGSCCCRMEEIKGMNHRSNMLSFNYDYDPGDDPSYDDPRYIECQLGNQLACNSMQEEFAKQQVRNSRILFVITIIIIGILIIYFIAYVREIIDTRQKKSAQSSPTNRKKPLIKDHE